MVIRRPLKLKWLHQGTLDMSQLLKRTELNNVMNAFNVFRADPMNETKEGHFSV